MTYPMPFTGTEKEALANYRTHRWGPPPDCRCWNCDCKPGHVAASYPCGQEPPRVQAAERRIMIASYSLIDSQAEADEREPGGPL